MGSSSANGGLPGSNAWAVSSRYTGTSAGTSEPTPEISPGAPLFGAIVQSIRAAGIGASPESSTPFDRYVCDGRCGSNGPNVGNVKSSQIREKGPERAILTAEDAVVHGIEALIDREDPTLRLVP